MSPTYEYRCFLCQYLHKETRSIHSDPHFNPPCPKCQKPMPRIYTSPGVTFKGTGWGKDR